ncbi:hypothetical protein CERSUDRAFT_95505 [Gelatoporia subvermispora B]|uniref:C2H2-type domain-containing protein n=1 Tax=Ceriporiopsis subvermispora (strain B) TaxID=914234 RepID=M2RBI8_CERS8|nr:hypothetical protein CERSUDRAFT_95505 [Gelatoporia subvermispora B]
MSALTTDDLFDFSAYYKDHPAQPDDPKPGFRSVSSLCPHPPTSNPTRIQRASTRIDALRHFQTLSLPSTIITHARLFPSHSDDTHPSLDDYEQYLPLVDTFIPDDWPPAGAVSSYDHQDIQMNIFPEFSRFIESSGVGSTATNPITISPDHVEPITPPEHDGKLVDISYPLPTWPEGSPFTDSSEEEFGLSDLDAEGEPDEDFANVHAAFTGTQKLDATVLDVRSLFQPERTQSPARDATGFANEDVPNLQATISIDEVPDADPVHEENDVVDNETEEDDETREDDALAEIIDANLPLPADDEEHPPPKQGRSKSIKFKVYVHPFDDPNWSGECKWTGCDQYGRKTRNARELARHIRVEHVRFLQHGEKCQWLDCGKNRSNGRRHLLDTHCKLLQAQCQKCLKVTRDDWVAGSRHLNCGPKQTEGRGATVAAAAAPTASTSILAQQTTVPTVLPNRARPSRTRTQPKRAHVEDDEDEDESDVQRATKKRRTQPSSDADDDDYDPFKRRRSSAKSRSSKGLR